jgi:hypothetical protein
MYGVYYCIPFTAAQITSYAQGVYRNLQVCWSSCKSQFLFNFNQNWNVWTNFPISNFMKIHSAVLGLYTDGQSDMMEPMGAFLELFIVNMPELKCYGVGQCTTMPKV